MSEEIALIPRPVRAAVKGGRFRLTADTWIEVDERTRPSGEYLRELLLRGTGMELALAGGEVEGGAKRCVALQLDPGLEHLGKEGYTLSVSPDRVSVRASSPGGVFYGVQSLRQLLPAEVEQAGGNEDAEWAVPCVEVEDYPRFSWRGYMLDEGRHFHGKETVLRTLDLMALQKLNVLHWHLTEDQGWRIEIKRYPKLTGVGAMRAGTARRLPGKGHDGVPHGGFYTPEEIREIVAYAAERQITVVPEIEMPGHSRAALAAYPELSCTGGPFEVACRFGIMLDIYCAGREEVFTFVQNVLDEVMALFPSPCIHIGGDEVLKGRWKRCPHCQARMRKEGLKNVHELQVYFTNRIADYLAAHGRRAVGWNDVLQEGLAENAVVQYWIRKRRAVVEAMRGGRDAVVSSFLYAYLDHSFSLTPLRRAYDFEPVFPELDEKGARHVLGPEALMWSESVPNQARLDYQTYPRLTAFAETGWSPKEGKDFQDFRRRLEAFLPRLDRLGVGYAPPAEWNPSWIRRLPGIFTIAQPQTKTRTGSSYRMP